MQDEISIGALSGSGEPDWAVFSKESNRKKKKLRDWHAERSGSEREFLGECGWEFPSSSSTQAGEKQTNAPLATTYLDRDLPIARLDLDRL
jgi:hypothetical protein